MSEWPVERDGHEYQPLPETWLHHPHACDSEKGGPRCLAVSCEIRGGRILRVRYAHPVSGNVVETVGGAASIPGGDGYGPVGLVNATGWPRSFVPSPGEPTDTIRSCERVHLFFDRAKFAHTSHSKCVQFRGSDSLDVQPPTFATSDRNGVRDIKVSSIPKARLSSIFDVNSDAQEVISVRVRPSFSPGFVEQTMSNDVHAIEYHERTKHTPQSVRGGTGLNFDNKPRPYKIYEDVPSVSLGDSIPEPSMPALEAVSTQNLPDTDDIRSVDRETLAALCYYAAGITKTIRRRGQEYDFRAAACTGALYHIGLYLVCGDLTDVDAGVYYYDPRTDSLELLREGDYRGVLADASRGPAGTHAPATFVATSTWWRNAWKYRARTYRHAFWDSGTVLANLVATAHALDVPAKVVLGFADESVATLLGIDPRWEAPLELVPVGAGDPIAGASDAASVDSINVPTEPLDSDPEEYPLIHQAWTGSTLPDGTTAREWRSRGERPVDGRDPGDGKRIELDPVDPQTASNRPLHKTIHRRGSCREYERDTLSFRKVATVLDRAIRGVPMDVRAADGDSGEAALQFVDCYCIVNGIEDIEQGAYQYHPEAGKLELLHPGEYRQEAGHLALNQRLGADAAACLYFMADLDAVSDILDDRGYRVAQLEAALTAGRLYLATYAHSDLGGTGLTFFDDEVTEFFEPRAAGQTPMFLYTLGRPA